MELNNFTSNIASSICSIAHLLLQTRKYSLVIHLAAFLAVAEGLRVADGRDHLHVGEDRASIQSGLVSSHSLGLVAVLKLCLGTDSTHSTAHQQLSLSLPPVLNG